MNNQDELSRISIDIPMNLQRKLKSLAALHDKSMRKIVIEAIEKKLQELENKSKIFIPKR